MKKFKFVWSVSRIGFYFIKGNTLYFRYRGNNVKSCITLEEFVDYIYAKRLVRIVPKVKVKFKRVEFIRKNKNTSEYED